MEFVTAYGGHCGHCESLLGGAKVVLATVTSNKAMAETMGGLEVNGKLVILGASFEPLQLNALPMIGQRQSIAGWPSGKLH